MTNTGDNKRLKEEVESFARECLASFPGLSVTQLSDLMDMHFFESVDTAKLLEDHSLLIKEIQRRNGLVGSILWLCQELKCHMAGADSVALVEKQKALKKAIQSTLSNYDRLKKTTSFSFILSYDRWMVRLHGLKKVIILVVVFLLCRVLAPLIIPAIQKLRWISDIDWIQDRAKDFALAIAPLALASLLIVVFTFLEIITGLPARTVNRTYKFDCLSVGFFVFICALILSAVLAFYINTFLSKVL